MNAATQLIQLFCFLITLSAVAVSAARADPLVIDAAVSARQGGEAFHLGTARSPDGQDLTADQVSLLLDGKPWIGAMGEMHFSRLPQSEWREELLKMKAGGIDIVSSYVFWIHHEEVEGKFDWEGQKNLGAFVSLCGELGLKVFVRCGPWAHGECRNGGFPDWMMHKGFKLRSTDPAYLAEVTKLYQEIGKQLAGKLWKDGGPVIGIQVENEYSGSPEYMIQLKQTAIAAGIDVPLYTRTGWPAPRKPYPPGELLPMFGAYTAGFWERNTSPTGGRYGNSFLFVHERIDTLIGSDQLGDLPSTEPAQSQSYPYLCCEMGGGMETSYHRRIHVDPREILALSIVKLGSGNNLPGYYMYHGGTNPDGQLSTLQESQATAYPNDMPVKNYDFQTALGEYGQVREQYHLLRREHMFLHDFGSQLAPMPAILPQHQPAKNTDTQTLRWSVRTNGDAGYLFINNYQTLQPMPAKNDVQFEVRLKGEALRVPSVPLSIPADSSFFWPFNFDLGGTKLVYATAQPICHLVQGNTTYTVFAETGNVPPELAFAAEGLNVVSTNGESVKADGRVYLRSLKPGVEPAATLRAPDGRESVIILLDEPTSLACWKGTLAGKETIFLTKANLTIDGNTLALTSDDPAQLSVDLLPAPSSLKLTGRPVVDGTKDGVFSRFVVPESPRAASSPPVAVKTEVVQQAAPAREIHMGHGKVAEAPSDQDFDQAAVWRIKFSFASANQNLLLRIHYVGDVARLYLDGKLIDDNFYNGNTFDLGLNRFASAVFEKELLLKVLPLRKDAPIYVPKEAMPQSDEPAVAQLKGIDLIENHILKFDAPVAKVGP